MTNETECRVYLRGRIQSSENGYSNLIRINDEMKNHPEADTYVIDMSNVTWFDANMCAPLGAVLYAFLIENKAISIVGMNDKILSILQINGFLPNFGFDKPKKPDHYKTTIEYQRFEGTSSETFKEYVAKHFVGKGIPQMTDALYRKFRQSISEIFENARDHSESHLGIFACGQYYRQGNRLDFSIADLGIGIKNNVLKHRGKDLSPESAIAWAMEEGNTTRTIKDGKPGGLGLKLIRDFVSFNKGKIHIISDAGFWSFIDDEVIIRVLELPFPGTLVNIEINTADTQSYRLKEEVDPSKIF